MIMRYFLIVVLLFVLELVYFRIADKMFMGAVKNSSFYHMTKL